jgi:hypothetical protein
MPPIKTHVPHRRQQALVVRSHRVFRVFIAACIFVGAYGFYTRRVGLTRRVYLKEKEVRVEDRASRSGEVERGHENTRPLELLVDAPFLKAQSDHALCIHGYRSSSDTGYCSCNNGWLGKDCGIDALPSCNRTVHVTADDVLNGKVRVFDYQFNVPEQEYASCDCVDECLEYLVHVLGEHIYLKKKAEPFYQRKSRCVMNRTGNDGLVHKAIVNTHPLVLDRKERMMLRQIDDLKRYATDKPEKIDALEIYGPDGFQYPHNCPLNCSDRGTCKFHECECDETSYGLWCHFDETELSSERELSKLGENQMNTAPRLKFSIIDLPGVVRRQRLGVYNRYRSFHTSYGYLFFMNSLLRNKSLLVPKLETTTIQIIPYFNTDVLTSNGEIEYNQLVVEYVKERILNSETNLTEAVDEVPYTLWFNGQDRSFCSLNDYTRNTLPHRSIVMGLYGFHRNNNDEACFDREMDIVIPAPYSFVHGSSHGYGTGENAHFDPEVKSGPLLFFSGNLKQFAANCTLDNFFNHTDECIKYYSQGVRPWIHAFYKEEKDFWINRKEHNTGTNYNIFQLDKQPISKFCLVTGGVGYDSRLIDSISSGCVPLLTMRNESLPFDTVLDYSQFAVKAELEHFQILPRFLKEVDADRHAKMISNLRTVREALAWHNSPLTEYEKSKHSDSNFQVLNGAFAHSILALTIRTETEIPKSVKFTLCEMYYRSKWNPNAFEILRQEARDSLGHCT